MKKPSGSPAKRRALLADATRRPMEAYDYTPPPLPETLENGYPKNCSVLIM